MKHKKIIVLGSLVTVLGVGMTSCGEDFLYKAPQGAIDQEALSTAAYSDLVVTNAYAMFTYKFWYMSVFDWVFGAMYGGDAHKGSTQSDQSVLNTVQNYNPISTNSYLSARWNMTAYGVARANLAINVINSCEDMEASQKTIRLAEMKFLRGLFYFEGAKAFGATGFPYVDETMAAAENDPKTHNGVDIYPKIIQDLQDAISGLPDTQSEVGRANKTAAKALLAKVYMQEGDMSSAEPLLKDVIDNGLSPKGAKLQLAKCMDDNFNSATENGVESIFDVQFSMTTNCSHFGYMLNFPYGGSSVSTCCGFYQPTYDLADSYKVDANGLPYLNNEYQAAPHVSIYEGGTITTNTTLAVDPRLDFAVGRVDIPYKDWGCMQQAWIRDITNGGPFEPKKHVYHYAEYESGMASNSVCDGWAPGSAMNLQYLSLRDIKLLYAECLANDGNLSGAMEQVNDIRNRAADPSNIVYKVTMDAAGRQATVTDTPAANYVVKPYPTSHAAFSNKDVCVKAIRMERKLELAMEGQRFFDLCRWGGDYMNKTLASYIAYEKTLMPTLMSGASAPTADKTYFPIPLTQIQTMGNDPDGNPYLVDGDAWK